MALYEKFQKIFHIKYNFHPLSKYFNATISMLWLPLRIGPLLLPKTKYLKRNKKQSSKIKSLFDPDWFPLSFFPYFSP